MIKSSNCYQQLMHPQATSHTECYEHSNKIDDKKSCLHIRNTTQVNDKCAYELYCCYYYYG